MVGPNLIESTQPVSRVRRARFGFLYVLLAVAVVSLLGRSSYLQVVKGKELRARAEGNRVSAILESAPRGIITDRFGIQLVENVASTDVVIDPLLLPPEEHEAPLIERLPAVLDVSREEIQEKIQQARQGRRIVIIRKAIPHDLVLRLEETQAELPGVQLVSSLVRKYPFGASLAHVLGYTSPVSSGELEESEDLIPTDITGKAGIERHYDQPLRGRHGSRYVEVNAQGHAQKELGQQAAYPGTALQLGLDQKLQEYIFERFREREQAAQDQPSASPPAAGAVVALDPRTGEIRALVSYPSFDPNVFSQPALQTEAQHVLTAPHQPLFNRVTDGTYPPGSTIKPLLAAAGLEEGIIAADTTVQSTGGIQVGIWSFPDWKSGGHGVTDVRKAIAESVNTFFYLLAGGDETHDGLGVQRITRYLESFGWGQPTGIDLPNEASGFLPSPDWKERVKQEPWYIGDTYHLGIGQGDVLATPLQIAVATGALAQRGTWYEPHLVSTETEPNRAAEPHDPQAHQLSISAAQLEVVRSGMRQTVTDGSGRGLNALPLPLAGKTGTAQIGGTKNTHAWFTSFGPYDSPELVVTVLLEQGGEGDDHAVPLAREIWQWWADNRQ